jgi:hypothetical protein
MHSRTRKTIILAGLCSLVIGCTSKSTPRYEDWHPRQELSSLPYSTNDTVQIDMSWSRIGPFSQLETRLRANVLGGEMEVYGAQSCRGQFVRNDSMLPANGWWEIICADGSYSAGNFRLRQNGDILGTGADANGEYVSFDLPLPK